MINNIQEFLEKRPLSWSAISSFEYSKDQWYRSYILGEKQTSKEMDFGKVIDQRFQDDPTFLPTIPRGETLQLKLSTTFSKIPLIGVPDIISIEKDPMIGDLKTGRKAWDQRRADETGQLTFYSLLVYLNYKLKPEDFRFFIYWVPTMETEDFKVDFKGTDVHIIETKRTMSDLLKFGQRIKDTVNAMDEYIKRYPQDKLSP
jgi:hypothetical protein